MDRGQNCSYHRFLVQPRFGPSFYRFLRFLLNQTGVWFSIELVKPTGLVQFFKPWVASTLVFLGEPSSLGLAKHWNSWSYCCTKPATLSRGQTNSFTQSLFLLIQMTYQVIAKRLGLMWELRNKLRRSKKKWILENSEDRALNMKF